MNPMAGAPMTSGSMALLPTAEPLPDRRLTDLQRLCWLRTIALFALLAVKALAYWGWGLALPYAELSAVSLFLAALNGVTTWRLRQLRRVGVVQRITDAELTLQLGLDLAALTVVLYLTGGSTNPFTALYLLPLTIAAVMLPRRQTWCLAGLTALAYTLLLFYYQPLAVVEDDHATAMRLHIVGMWLTFLLSAALIAYFVVRIRERDQMLAQVREWALRDERILALATLSAGAAHELGTPLATLAVLAGEIQADYADDQALMQDIALMRRQVEHCKTIISEMLAAAGQGRLDDCTEVQVAAFVDAVLAQWRLLRPLPAVDWQPPVHPAPVIRVDATLRQALVNLLNNAADAADRLQVMVDWTPQVVRLTIRDFGPGLPAGMLPGVAFATTKPGGRGLGLFLARASIERLGGQLQLADHPQGGVQAVVVLPVAR